jgi:hypothetical protein
MTIPMEVTLVGIVIEVSDVHPEKAWTPNYSVMLVYYHDN